MGTAEPQAEPICPHCQYQPTTNLPTSLPSDAPKAEAVSSPLAFRVCCLTLATEKLIQKLATKTAIIGPLQLGSSLSLSGSYSFLATLSLFSTCMDLSVTDIPFRG